MVIETTVAFNKTGVPDAIAWKWNLDRTGFVVHVSQHVGLVKSDEASIGVLKRSFTRPQAWQNCTLCLGYDQPTWTLSKGFLLFSI